MKVTEYLNRLALAQTKLQTLAAEVAAIPAPKLPTTAEDTKPLLTLREHAGLTTPARDEMDFRRGANILSRAAADAANAIRDKYLELLSSLESFCSAAAQNGTCGLCSLRGLPTGTYSGLRHSELGNLLLIEARRLPPGHPLLSLNKPVLVARAGEHQIDGSLVAQAWYTVADIATLTELYDRDCKAREEEQRLTFLRQQQEQEAKHRNAMMGDPNYRIAALERELAQLRAERKEVVG